MSSADIRENLKKSIDEALQGLFGKTVDFTLEHPDLISHGDYSTNVALILSKEQKTPPRQLAEVITAKLTEKNIERIEKIEVAGAGFVNFYLSRDFFTESIRHILKEKEKFGRSDIGAGKKILVEYSSPNIAKPFTIGHLRSTIIGDAVANILSFLGFSVVRDNHLGDWGTQFGKQIVALKRWGSLKELEKSKNGMRYLVDLYVRFHTEAENDPALEDEARAWFVKLEQGDREAREIYETVINVSMKYFSSMYARLHVSSFDTFHGEAFYEPLLPEVLKDIEKAGIAKESEGAKLVFFPEEKYPPLMIQKKDGATLYATRDLATDKWRKKEYGKNITIVNEAGTEQTLYFAQLFEVEEMLGYFKKENRVYIGHGFIRALEGKMSTRKGNAIWLEEVLDEAMKRAGEIDKESAEIVGIGAIKFNDLKREAKQDIVFNWEEVVNLKGDSGPYLQYSYARARSILEKAKKEDIKLTLDIQELEISKLEKMLYRFGEVVERAGKDYAPHYIAAYLIETASLFNAYYAQNKIIEKNDPTSSYRVALTEAFSIVLKNGLALLGIGAPERM